VIVKIFQNILSQGVVSRNIVLSLIEKDVSVSIFFQCPIISNFPVYVRATVEQLSRDLAGDPKHIYKHKYTRKVHLAGDPKRKG